MRRFRGCYATNLQPLRAVARALALAALLVCGAAHAGSLGTVGATLSAGALVDTYFIFPDNQSMAQAEFNTPTPWGQLGATHSDLEQIATWVCNNRDAYNIKAGVHVGDIVVNGGSSGGVWTNIVNYSTILENCGIPWLPDYGGHDGELNGANPQRWDSTDNADLYHLNVGRTAMASKGWFAGSRGEYPDWEYCIETDTDGTCITSTYAEGTPRGRTYWVPIPPLNFAMMEWQYGIRISNCANGQAVCNDPIGPTANNPGATWVDQLRKTYAHDYWIHVSHAGPCDSPNNCDFTPANGNPANGIHGGDWTGTVHHLGPQFITFLNGHWGRGGDRSCWAGSGNYRVETRDDGSNFIAGVFDFQCGVRLDPSVAANNCQADGGNGPPGPCPGPDCVACPSVPYTWSGWMQLKRTSRQLCLNTIRTIDVDADDDGTPNSGVGAAARATILTPAEFDRGTLYGDPDPLDPNAHACNGDFDDGPINEGCPNEPETCIDIVALPEP